MALRRPAAAHGLLGAPCRPGRRDRLDRRETSGAVRGRATAEGPRTPPDTVGGLPPPRPRTETRRPRGGISLPAISPWSSRFLGGSAPTPPPPPPPLPPPPHHRGTSCTQHPFAAPPTTSSTAMPPSRHTFRGGRSRTGEADRAVLFQRSDRLAGSAMFLSVLIAAFLHPAYRCVAGADMVCGEVDEYRREENVVVRICREFADFLLRQLCSAKLNPGRAARQEGRVGGGTGDRQPRLHHDWFSVRESLGWRAPDECAVYR